MQWLGKRTKEKASLRQWMGVLGRASSVAAKVGFSARALSLRMMAG